MRGILPRLNVFRAAAVPRIVRPLLPTSSTHLPIASALTSSPRHARLITHFPPRLSTDRPSPSSSPPPPEQPHPLPPDASLSQRLKHLIKTYGWYALGVYSVLTVLDFGVAFLGVNLLGAEYVSGLAASARRAVADILHARPAEPGRDELDGAQAAPGGQEGLYAMLVLAYTIHKTLFLPVRVGLTAALTPRLVGWLTQRGWAGGAGTRRAASEMRTKLRERRERSSGES